MLEALIKTGVNIFRFNMSHAPHDWVRKTATAIREVSRKIGIQVALLLDTQGPAIRTAPVPATIDLKVGDVLSFTVKEQVGTEVITVSVNYPDLVDDIVVGQIVIVDNGNIRLKAIERRPNEIVCEVLTPGPLGSRRHINLPGVHVKLPALTEKDWGDLELAFECDMDYIAMSFVRQAIDLDGLRAKIKEKGSQIRIVSKIEDQIAVRNLEEIIAASDGIMVARGDLGIEVPYEELPIIQRRMINLCLKAVKPVIVATHLLESMIVNPSPTRAEITDIANAVFEHADAIMLSGETTTGKYPLECVEIMDRIAKRIELSKTVMNFINPLDCSSDNERLLSSAVHLANATKAQGICIFTTSGRTAAFIAGLRPQVSPVYAFTPTMKVARRLLLNFSVASDVIDFSPDPSQTVLNMHEKINDHRYLQPGDRVVIVSDLKMGKDTIHAIYLHEIPAK
jgi:pyruvate kinase